MKLRVIDKNKQYPKDNRTLAVNANSKDFLISLGLWNKLKANPEPINKIEISDTINQSPLIFENNLILLITSAIRSSGVEAPADIPTLPVLENQDFLTSSAHVT